LFRTIPTRGIQSIRAADQQAEIAPCLQPARQSFGQFNGTPFPSPFIQGDEVGTGRNGRQQSFALGADDTGQIRRGAAWASGNFNQVQGAFAGQPPGVFQVAGFDPVRRPDADSEQVDFQVASNYGVFSV
jgi:hypothetical protein